jgi:hypothetical protein
MPSAAAGTHARTRTQGVASVSRPRPRLVRPLSEGDAAVAAANLETTDMTSLRSPPRARRRAGRPQVNSGAGLGTGARLDARPGARRGRSAGRRPVPSVRGRARPRRAGDTSGRSMRARFDDGVGAVHQHNDRGTCPLGHERAPFPPNVYAAGTAARSGLLTGELRMRKPLTAASHTGMTIVGTNRA